MDQGQVERRLELELSYSVIQKSQLNISSVRNLLSAHQKIRNMLTLPRAMEAENKHMQGLVFCRYFRVNSLQSYHFLILEVFPHQRVLLIFGGHDQHTKSGNDKINTSTRILNYLKITRFYISTTTFKPKKKKKLLREILSYMLWC